MPNLVAVAADKLLIIMYNPAPLASYLERIRNWGRRQNHTNESIAIFNTSEVMTLFILQADYFAFDFAVGGEFSDNFVIFNECFQAHYADI